MKIKFKLPITHNQWGITLLSLWICGFVILPKVNAQAVTLSIDPPIVQTKIKPSKSLLIAYSVENKGDPVALKFKMYAFHPTGRYGGVELTDLEGPIEFMMENTDIAFDTPFFFNTKDRKQALIRISIPSTAPEGDYYYMVVAETVPTSLAEGRSSSLTSAQLGSPLLITVTETGITNIQARIAEFSVKSQYEFNWKKRKIKVVDSTQPLPVTLVVQNLGTNVIQPEGSLSVNGGGKNQAYPLLGQNILKNSERLVRVKTADSIPNDVSMVVRSMALGKNVISAQVSYGPNTPLQYATEIVYAFPFRLVWISIVTLVACTLVLFSVKKGKKKTDNG